jgi:hypothetical protein
LFLPDLKELAEEIAEIKRAKSEEEDKENKPGGNEEENQEDELKTKEELLENVKNMSKQIFLFHAEEFVSLN